MELKHMTQAILESGMSQKALADEVGTTQTTIHRALHGADIRYSVGRKIERVYEQVASTRIGSGGTHKKSNPSKSD